jgi:hypothetical protein
MAGKIESTPNGTAQTVHNLTVAVQRRRLESLKPKGRHLECHQHTQQICCRWCLGESGHLLGRYRPWSIDRLPMRSPTKSLIFAIAMKAGDRERPLSNRESVNRQNCSTQIKRGYRSCHWQKDYRQMTGCISKGFALEADNQ